MRKAEVLSDPEESASQTHQSQRSRAPTITVDTSAVLIPSLHGGPSLPPIPLSSAQRQRSLSVEDTPLLSNSRPTSHHRLYSYASIASENSLNPQTFLAVPATRSRGSSVDHAGSVSSFGGETLTPTPTLSDHGDSHFMSSDVMSICDSISPLKANLGDEGSFQVDDNPFAFSPGLLSKLYNPKSITAFCAVGCLQGLVHGLRTDRTAGLGLEESALEGTVDLDQITQHNSIARAFAARKTQAPNSHFASHDAAAQSKRGTGPYIDRKRVFGINRLPDKKSKNIFQIMWITFNDKVLIILTIVAVISLVLGLYQDYRRPDEFSGPKVRWVEGVTIMVAVAIVVVVGSLNDYQKEQQFIKLNKKKTDHLVKVIRSGKPWQLSVFEILAGDVLYLEPGDIAPADGVLISGYNVQCDESSITGESDQKQKISGDTVMAQIELGAGVSMLDPFIVSGSKVLEGTGTYLVTNVGVHSSYGKLIMALTDESDITPTPLQVKLNSLASQITKVGCTMALFLFLVLFAKFIWQVKTESSTPTDKAEDFLQIVVLAITIIVIAVPEGLPLAVTLALAFAMTKMLKDNNLVRVLSSCETMGNATAICSDKTGTLTMNKMTVVAGRLGATTQFGVLGETPEQRLDSAQQVISNDHLAKLLSTIVRNTLVQSIAVNSTAFEGEEVGKRTYIGSKTETALLFFAKEYLGMGPVSEERANANIIRIFPFDSARKCMATVTKLPNNSYRMYVKGASEILLAKCTRILTDPTQMSLRSSGLTKNQYDMLADAIAWYASKSLRTIGMVYRDFDCWPPQEAILLGNDSREVNFEDIFHDLVFLGIVGIQDPLRSGVQDAVKQCQRAGVVVRMVTGDNVGTAKAVAEECGIYTPNSGIVLEGPDFRKLSEAQMNRVIPRLQVLARSSSEDKRVLVQRLRALGETVAVTGDGTNDGPALRAADVGFSMGISGTEIAKDASSIILMDDNFSSIVKALGWGRAVNDSVRKFIQFQLTVNITAVGVSFISAVFNPNEEPILTPVQLLWVNLIMDTFAALALATDPPTSSIFDRKPDPKSVGLITLDMWKMIIGQAIYQLVVTFGLNFYSNIILNYRTEEELRTLIFNVFVWMQIFNELNNRRLDNKFNIFEGIHRNPFFLTINIVTICVQVIIVTVGGSALSTTPLNITQWGVTMLLGAISLIIGVLIRMIPNAWIRAFINILPLPRTRESISFSHTSANGRYTWNPALEHVRQELAVAKIRRGRHFPTLKFPWKWRQEREGIDIQYSGYFGVPAHDTSIPRTPNDDANSHRILRSPGSNSSALGATAVMAGVVAGSVAGWSPVVERDPTRR